MAWQSGPDPRAPREVVGLKALGVVETRHVAVRVLFYVDQVCIVGTLCREKGGEARSGFLALDLYYETMESKN